jgi:hypothetical protein|tara:strand:+ start:6051 stop:6299 length:249 start_codon:yes stop_codon:yes gene_type:complete
LRVTVLAATFLFLRFLVKLAILPTLMLMFTLRWFIMNPIHKKPKLKRKSDGGGAKSDNVKDENSEISDRGHGTSVSWSDSTY